MSRVAVLPRVRRLDEAKHRRRDDHLPEAVQRYEALLLLLHWHRPANRSGLCLDCGQNWPCVAVQVAVHQRWS
jgi:hypothetical protein